MSRQDHSHRGHIYHRYGGMATRFEKENLSTPLRTDKHSGADREERARVRARQRMTRGRQHRTLGRVESAPKS